MAMAMVKKVAFLQKTCLADKSWRIEEQTGEQTSGKEGKNKNEVEL